jgi:predicted phage terminase large subunit-like protein
LARSEFLAYATFIDPAYQVSPHIRLLGGYLDAVLRGDIRRLAITAPPRHSKSESTTGKLPALAIGQDTTRTVMIGCHSADLAETFSIQNRETVARNPRWPMVFPDVTINPARRSADIWAVNDRRESVIARGILGGQTGYGAWLFIYDDPIKTYEQASSPTHRDKVYQEYKTSSRTRLTPDGRIVVIMTRWNEDDLIGRITRSEEGPDWVFLHLPALSYGTEADYRFAGQTELEFTKATEKLPKTAFPDPLGRPKGDPLWPERFSKSFLLGQKVAMQHEFEALYQGNPSAPEGAKFKREWFRPITAEILDHLKPKVQARMRSYDLAWSAKQRADYTVGLRSTLYTIEPPDPEDVEDTVVAAYLKRTLLPPVILVLEVLDRWKKEWDESSEDIIKLAQSDTDKYKLLIEAVAAQNVGWKTVKKDLRMWKHKVLPFTTDKDKEARAKYALRLASRGVVLILYPQTTVPPAWERDFLNELGQFPYGANDDQVDAFTQTVNHWQPKIDQLLTKVPVGVWKLPFAAKAQAAQQAVKHLPPPFQPVPVGGSPFPKMGWIK